MEIKLYASPSCKWSKLGEEFLKKQEIGFEFLDVMDNHKLWKEVLEKSYQLSTPVLDVDGKILVGFNQEEWEKALVK